LLAWEGIDLLAPRRVARLYRLRNSLIRIRKVFLVFLFRTGGLCSSPLMRRPLHNSPARHRERLKGAWRSRQAIYLQQLQDPARPISTGSCRCFATLRRVPFLVNIFCLGCFTPFAMTNAGEPIVKSLMVFCFAEIDPIGSSVTLAWEGM